MAACLYRGGLDVHTRLRGPVNEATADTIYRECRRFGTTLQVPEHMWPTDRAAFYQYWACAMAELRIDPPVRDYLDRLIMLDYLPRPFGTALGPLNRFLTTGFLPPPFREQMQLPWTERDQRQFDLLIQMVASVYRLLPAPVARFPFNASLRELRLRRMRNRLIQLRPAVTSRPVREIKTFWTKRTVVHALSPVRHFASVGGDSQVQAGPGSSVASGAPLGVR